MERYSPRDRERVVTDALGSEMPQMAVIDTAFHIRMPRVTRLFARARRPLQFVIPLRDGALGTKRLGKGA
jgi:acetate kinase